MKKFSKIVVASIIAASTIGLSSTLAWLIPIAKFTNSDVSIGGTTEGAYFAYGEGTAEKPYGISNQRHLYNLAWLQYLGTYDGGQFYFELADTIEDGILDMEGWTLPPIGTEDHPFIGNFNGNGKIIDGVVVSNNFDDFNRYPSVVSKNLFETNLPKVVGFFGVVGELDNNISYLDYDEQVNEFKNTGLSNITVVSNATETLVGVAAGYSDGNIFNVAVEAPTVEIVQEDVAAYDEDLTTNLSDHGVVGYTTKTGEISKIDNEIYGVNVTSDIEFNAASDGNAEGWGGSINMKTIYERLLKIKTTYASNNSSFVWRQKKYFYDGVENESERVNISGVTAVSGDSTAQLLNYNRSTVGNFNFFDRSSRYDSFMYLVGGHDEVRTYRIMDTQERLISDGINHLVYDNGQLKNTVTGSNATSWTFEAVSNKYYIYTSPDSITKYYLYYNNGSLGIRTNQDSTGLWTVTENGNKMTIDYNNLSKLVCNRGGIWQLVTTSTPVYDAVIASSGYYISNTTGSGVNVVRTNNLSQAARFSLDSNGYVVVVNNPNGIMYLAGNSTSNLRFISSYGVSDYHYFTYANDTLTCSRSGYFVRYTSSWFSGTWSYGTSIDGRVSNYSNGSLASDLIQEGLLDLETNQENSHMYYTAQDTTYFPLNVNKDGTSGNPNTTDYEPVESNTGYIISGASLTDASVYDKDKSVIRVSLYPKSNLGTSINSTTGLIDDANVFTYDVNNVEKSITTAKSDTASGDVPSGADLYKRYDESKSAFYNNALNGSSNVFGLHFMPSVVNMKNIVNANNVSILGNDYSTYDLPVNSIDFNLKQKGTVNFFAGTYFPGNDSFFSLHEVIRGNENDPTIITEIREIEAIYSNDNVDQTTKYSNIYKYKTAPGEPALYSKPYRFDANQNKFDMDKNSTIDLTTEYVEHSTMDASDFNLYKATYGYKWVFNSTQIGKQNSGVINMNRLYYFEFPMNGGEYCLGSVDGGTGAYLCYLDIGANAAKTQRTIFYETFQETIRTFEYPFGVAIVSATTVQNSVVDPTDTANVVIKPAYYGALSITRVANDVTVLKATGMDDNAHPTLVGELMWDESHQQYNIHDGGDPSPTNLTDDIECVLVVRDITRVQYYDYNVNMAELTITAFTDVSTDGGNTFVRTVSQDLADSTHYDNSTISSIKFYNHLASGTLYSPEDLMNQTTIKSYLTGANPSLMIHLYYVQPNGVTVDLVINLEVANDETRIPKRYYVFADYLLEFTVENGSITVLVIERGTGTVKIGETTIDENTVSVTIPTPQP